MKVLILGGFLGSGKTTALNSLAHYIVDHSTSDVTNKVMILENEVGKNSIDDKFLGSNGLKVDTIFSGCACCTVSGELVNVCYKLEQEFAPDWVILETTGIAYPKKIQDNLTESLGIESRIVVLTDAVRWKRLLIPMNNLLSGQIVGSDAVLVNKCDLSDEEKLLSIEEDIHAFDPKPPIFRISALNGVADETWAKVLGEI